MDLDGESALDCYALALSLPTALTVDTPDNKVIGVCHAEWPLSDWSKIETQMQDPKQVSSMLWGRKIIKEKVCKWDKSAAITIHGHTPVAKAEKLGSALYIDTGCVHGGHLTLIERSDALAMPSAC